MSEPTRKLAAIMFTDIVGYTALMDKDKHQAMKLLQTNREVQKPLIEKYNGTWLKELGDGTLSSFPSAIDAVNCAIEIQRALTWDPNHNLRIGIHVGDVVFEKGDVFGAGVNVASRLEPLAESGGICVSGRVYDDIANKPDIDTVFLGKKYLKNVDRPVKIYALIGEGLTEPGTSDVPEKTEDLRLDEFLSRKEAVPAPKVPRKLRTLIPYLFGALVIIILSLIFYPRFILEKDSKPIVKEINPKSIAVLPFTPFTKSEEDESFTAGIHDDILTQLSKIRDLMVISRTSVVQFKNTTKTMGQIAEELNVKNILEGSVRRVGNKIRIVAQLVDAVNDKHIWSETYDRDYADIFAIQSDVAQKIAASLKATLTPEEVTYIEEKPTENMEAYDYFLKGKHFWNTKTTQAGNQKAIDMFDKATELDPDFTLAYARVSITHSVLYGPLSWDHTPERKELAKSTLDKAIALDPDHPQVHFAEGMFQQECLNDFNSALKEYEIALKGEPNNGEITQYLGFMYTRLGNWEKAEETSLKAYELDPLGLNSAFRVGQFYRLLRQFDKANNYQTLAIQSNPEQAHYYEFKAWNYLAGFGDINKARSLLKEGRMSVPNPGWILETQFWTEIYSRDYSKALRYAKERKEYYTGSLLVGRAYYILGEEELAREEFGSMQVYYEDKIDVEPENAVFHSNLGLVYAYLGLKEKAITEGQKGIDLLSVVKDHLSGPRRLIDMAEIYVLTEEHELALESIEYLLSIPGSLTRWRLRLDPIYDPLRDNPRFQKLLTGN